MNSLKIFVAVIAFGFANYSLAQEPSNQLSIYESAIKWEDEVGTSKLFAAIPTWHGEDIKSIFEMYLHPEQSGLGKIHDENKYNIRFINVFWGPLDNPFNKLIRPAKVFVIVVGANAEYQYYLAPVVHDEADGEYYVFDTKQTQPISLYDWVGNIKNANQQQKNILINICNAYGSSPKDICNEKSYQDESTESFDNRQTDLFMSREEISSAVRALHQDWHVNLKKNSFKKSYDGTIVKESVEWNDEAARNKLLETVVAWPNSNIIQNNFEKIRNIRYFQDEVRVDFLRRITWLYPDDGCWTRASAVVKDLFGPYNNSVNQMVRPSKIFAFGNLCANTPNASKGYVAWWYHTAPIVRDAETNQSYVLDPSVNPYLPLTVEKWMAEISSRSGACAHSTSYVSDFNICNGYGTNPFSFCQEAFENEMGSALNQSTFRAYEYKRQMVLGRDPQKVLGDSPPWS